jgi:hypothetical protein
MFGQNGMTHLALVPFRELDLGKRHLNAWFTARSFDVP